MLSRLPLKILGFVAVVVIADIIALLIFFYIRSTNLSPSSDDAVSALPPPTNSTMGVFSQAAVVSVGLPCAGFGKDMLAKGGNAVDAAIATMLCDGVCVMQSMGVGGGFLMTIYNKTENKAYSLVARETAPAAATKDMYVNNTSKDTFGALAVAVPGELKGYQEVHKRFGRLPWSDLFQPTIKLCSEGVPVSSAMERQFASVQGLISQSPTLVEIILNSTGGRLPRQGDFLKLPLLAQTLRVISDSPNMAEELYNGSLTKQFVKDIQDGGGIITEQDMNNYSVRWEDPYSASLSGGQTVYSSALPGSGILVTFLLRLLDGLFQYAYSDNQRSQLVIEAFKHAYGRRTDLGDPHFVNKTVLDQAVEELTSEAAILSIRDKIKLNWTSDNVSYYGADYLPQDHGTDNIVVLDQQGNAVSVTSSVNLVLGSKFVSGSTGILLNNQMDDFSVPGHVNYFSVSPSEANFIVPGKRPMSSMAPTVVVDSQGDVVLAIGAAGGSRITTQVTHVAIKNLWLGKNIKEAIDEPRFHHQLLPMYVLYEYGILQDMVSAWRSYGHQTQRLSSDDWLATVTGIARLGANVTGCYDWRKGGSVDGF